MAASRINFFDCSLHMAGTVTTHRMLDGSGVLKYVIYTQVLSLRPLRRMRELEQNREIIHTNQVKGQQNQYILQTTQTIFLK